MTSGAFSVNNGQVEDEKRERHSRARGVAWPIIGRLGRLDPGSNPGAPTSMRSAIQAVRKQPRDGKQPQHRKRQGAEQCTESCCPSPEVEQQGEGKATTVWT